MMSDTEREPHEIERDIGRTRARLERNVDELQDRLSPHGLIDEASGYLREGSRAVGRGLNSAGESVGRAVRDNPVPAALMGTAVAWLAVSMLRNRGSHHHERSGHRHRGHAAPLGPDDRGHDAAHRRPAATARGAAGMSAAMRSAPDDGTISRTAADLKERAEHGADRLMSEGRRVGSAVRDGAHDLRERAGRYGADVRHSAQDTFDRQPLLIGVLGLAVGAAIGLALPATRRENELMGPYRDDLRERVEDYGRERVDRAERAADAAMTAARSEFSKESEDGAQGAGEKLSKAAQAAVTAAKDEAGIKSASGRPASS